MSGLRCAVSFLTVIPTGTRRDSSGFASARAWFPTVGLLLGALVAGLAVLVHWGFTAGSSPAASMPARALAAVVFVAALASLSRALHLDGFMDTCDALLGGSNPRERRRILKDPHVGAFAVVGVICLLLLKVTGVLLLLDHSRVTVLILAPCLSRWAVLLAMDAFPYAGGDGLGAAFLRKPGGGQLTFGSLSALVAGLCLGGGWTLVLIALGGLVTWTVGASSTKLLGGMTGDTYGAVNEATETATLLAAALLVSWAPSALRSPLSALGAVLTG